MESARLEEVKNCELIERILEHVNIIKERSLYNNRDLIMYNNRVLNNELLELLYEDTDIFDSLYYIFDAIKYRMISLDRNSTNYDVEREILKNTRNSFLKTTNLYKNQFVAKKEENESYYKIVDYFLKTEKNHMELKAIIEKNPKIINTRYCGVHIVIHILDLYIKNFEAMLKKQKHISKDYLREIYMLFTKNYSLSMTKEEKKIIDSKLEKFESKMRKTIKKSYKQKEVARDIKSLRSNNFYVEEKDLSFNKLKDVDYESLAYQSMDIRKKYQTLLDNPKRRNLIDENTTCVGTAAYSVVEENDYTILKMHVIDIKDIITVGSSMDIYLYNCLLQGIKPDKDISDLVILIKGYQYPTVTYELKLSKTGIIQNFDLYLSKIELKNKVGELAYLPEEYKTIYKRLSNQLGINKEYIGVKDVTSLFESVISKELSKYMKDRKIPFIYSGSKLETIKSSEIINNDLIGSLSSLNKKELSSIKKIIDDHNDSFHYSSRYLGDDGKYHLSIEEAISYLNLEYQRIIDIFIINKEKYTSVEISNYKRTMQRRVESLSDILNQSIKYVEPESIELNNGRIKTYRDVDKRFKSK